MIAKSNGHENGPPDIQVIEKKLREWWDKRDEGLNDALDIDSGEGAYRTLPTIDSKEAARAGQIIKEELGIEFDPSMVRGGGYDSFDDMLEHLLPQIKERMQGDSDD